MVSKYLNVPPLLILQKYLNILLPSTSFLAPTAIGGLNIEKIKIDDKTYSLLIRLLQERTGLNFQYYRKNHIEKRIWARMIRVNCRTLDDYYNYLFSNEKEFRQFIDSFNINFTLFFRDWEIYETFQQILTTCLKLKRESITSPIQPDPLQLAKFRTKENYLKNKIKNTLLPLIDINDTIGPYMDILSLNTKIKTRNRINIWSCACASGEEPYTIAMILDNLSKQFSGFSKFTIVASDLDQDAIISALTGLYMEDSMREITDFYKKKYFKIIQSRTGIQYLISDELKKYIEFVNEDVTKGHQNALTYDVIFCRYLLIYFNFYNRDAFIKIIEKHLNYGGLLILGKTETLFNKIDSLKLIDSINQIYLKIK